MIKPAQSIHVWHTPNGQIKKQSLICWICVCNLLVYFFGLLYYCNDTAVPSNHRNTLNYYYHTKTPHKTHPLEGHKYTKLKTSKKMWFLFVLGKTHHVRSMRCNISQLKGLFPASTWLRKQTAHLKACTRFRSANSWSSTKACRTLMLKSSLRRRRKGIPIRKSKAKDAQLPREHLKVRTGIAAQFESGMGKAIFPLWLPFSYWHLSEFQTFLSADIDRRSGALAKDNLDPILKATASKTHISVESSCSLEWSWQPSIKDLNLERAKNQITSDERQHSQAIKHGQALIPQITH